MLTGPGGVSFHTVRHALAAKPVHRSPILVCGHQPSALYTLACYPKQDKSRTWPRTPHCLEARGS